MHEISIAQSIVEIAEDKARNQNALSIQLIKLRLGEFTNIVPEALQFAFEVVRQGTLAEHAQLDIELVSMTLNCVVCKMATQPTRGLCLICTQCGFPLQIIAGEELQIEYIDVGTEQEGVHWNEYQSKQMY